MATIFVTITVMASVFLPADIGMGFSAGAAYTTSDKMSKSMLAARLLAADKADTHGRGEI
ncbi:hypothetical protein KCP75_08020 [Salmonella enterica subsp. enterica]|nr:hypothetical protein KCP75_08020 [Salmonella enterica subsp. enterica]